jgi:hypothetical protein
VEAERTTLIGRERDRSVRDRINLWDTGHLFWKKICVGIVRDAQRAAAKR